MFSALLERMATSFQYKDYRSGVIVSTLANIYRKKESAPFSPGSFFPSLKEVENQAQAGKQMTPDQMKALLQSIYPISAAGN